MTGERGGRTTHLPLTSSDPSGQHWVLHHFHPEFEHLFSHDLPSAERVLPGVEHSHRNLKGTSHESQGQHFVNFQLVPEGQNLPNVRDSRVELDSASTSEEEEVEGAAKAEMERRDRARVVRENRILRLRCIWEERWVGRWIDESEE